MSYKKEVKADNIRFYIELINQCCYKLEYWVKILTIGTL